MARRSANDGHTVTTSDAVDPRGREDESASRSNGGPIEIKVPTHRMSGDDPKNVVKSASRALLKLTLSEPPSDQPRRTRRASPSDRPRHQRSPSLQRHHSSRPRMSRDDGGSVISIGSAPVRGKMGCIRLVNDDEASAVSAASINSAPMRGASSNRKRVTLERLRKSQEQINKSYLERQEQLRRQESFQRQDGHSHQQHRPADSGGNSAHYWHQRTGGGNSAHGPIHIDNVSLINLDKQRRPRESGSGRRNEGSVYTAPTILNPPNSAASVRSAPTIVQNDQHFGNPRCHLSVVEKPRPRSRTPGNGSGSGASNGVDHQFALSVVPESQQHGNRYVDDIMMQNMSSGIGSHSPHIFGSGSDTASRRTSNGSNSPEMMYSNSSQLDPETFRRHLARGMQAPEGDVTIVFTDLQGSTTLWETHPPAMKAAVDLHDKIIRRCYGEHSGYEITTEGDAFQLAFQHPIDALAFALKTQVELHKADWSPEILALDDASEKDGFRGFRVRMGLHHGRTKSRVHVVTKRTFYVGEAVDIAKAMEGICYGGQILTTVETWRAVSGISEQVLGSPQVMDCGEHELDIRQRNEKGPLSKRVVQLVPKEYAFDYFAARGREEHPGAKHVRLKKESDVVGRKFAPLKTKKQVSASFVDAPYANGKVTIVFIYTKGTDDLPTEIRTKNLRILAKGVRSLLMQSNPPGYECQEENGSWMLAFGRIANAVSFGLRLVEAIDRAPLKGNIDRSKMFKIGIHTGPFTSMGPHTVTGRADYFGPVVNRAARVASQCELGQVLIGIPLPSGETPCTPDFGSKIITKLVGIRKLKGLTVDMALFSCARAPR